MENRQKKRRLYPPETAGRLMVEKEKLPIISSGTTLAGVKEMLDSKSGDYETIDYIYIVDKENKLQGVFSIKEFFKRLGNEQKADDIAITGRDIVAARAHTHQERAALLALKHSIKALPVLDKGNDFLGVIPFDAILKTLDKEAVEDILRFGGIYHKGTFDDLLRLSLFQSMKHRLPWLLLGLVGGLFAADIIGSFEETLSQNLVLAAFIPLVVYMASAVGMQMTVFVIRDMAINPGVAFLKYFFKQVAVVSLLGVTTSVILAILAFLLYGDVLISTVLGIALFFAVMSSVVSGLIIPYLFGKLKLDPANASGPVATIIQDIISVLVYFGVASLIL